MSKILPRTKLPIKLRKPTRRDVLWGIAASPIATTFLGSQRGLERELENYIDWWYDKHGQSRDDEKVACLAYPLDNKEDGNFLFKYGGEQFYQAASMIKPFLGLAYLSRCFDSNDNLEYGPNGRNLLRDSITSSHNDDTNRIIDILGGPGAVQETLQQYYPKIAEECEIVEKIPEKGKTYRNKATLRAYSKLSWQLAYRTDKPEIKELRRFMIRSPNRGNRLVKNVNSYEVPTSSTKNVPPSTIPVSKTGTTAGCYGDFGYLRYPNGDRCILACLVEHDDRHYHTNPFYARSREFIAGFSQLVYTHL